MAIAAGLTTALAAVGLCALAALTVRNPGMAPASDPPRVDCVFDDPAWRAARPVTIQTVGGVNLFAGSTTVTVGTLCADSTAYFLFEWQDPTRSFKHHPLQNTASGWRMLQDGFDHADETEYFEDKFSVMLSDASRLAALCSIHLGPRPVEGLPDPAGKHGLHDTDDGTVLDVWHWMAVRTDPMGQAEDDHFGPLRPPPGPDAPLQRYSGGNAPDPAIRGDQIDNWRDLLECPYSRSFDGGVVPRFLTADPADLESRLGTVNIDPGSSDDGAWWLPTGLVQPYTAALDARLREGMKEARSSSPRTCRSTNGRQVFGSQRLTSAILSRLTHHLHMLGMNGESFRLRESRKART